MKNKKHNLGCLVVILFAIILFGGLIVAISNPEQYSVKTFENLSVEQDKKAVEILKQCGISKIQEVTHDNMMDGDGLYGYRLKTDVGNVFAYFDNEKIRQVRFMSSYLYRNQAVEAVAQDFYVTDDEATKYQIECQKAVKEVLKSPATAKFPSILDWGFSKENGIVTVQSYVDSQNSFGAMLRTDFQFKIKLEDDTVISAIIDGTEYINN